MELAFWEALPNPYLPTICQNMLFGTCIALTGWMLFSSLMFENAQPVPHSTRRQLLFAAAILPFWLLITPMAGPLFGPTLDLLNRSLMPLPAVIAAVSLAEGWLSITRSMALKFAYKRP